MIFEFKPPLETRSASLMHLANLHISGIFRGFFTEVKSNMGAMGAESTIWVGVVGRLRYSTIVLQLSRER